MHFKEISLAMKWNSEINQQTGYILLSMENNQVF